MLELPDYLREEAGIPAGAKLCVYVDDEEKTVTIAWISSMVVICFFRTTTALSSVWISTFSPPSKPLILNAPPGIKRVPLFICLLNFIFFSLLH